MRKEVLVLSSSIRSVGVYLTLSTLSPASVQRTFLCENENTSALLNDLLRAWRAAEGKDEEAFASHNLSETGMPDLDATNAGDQLGFSDAYAQVIPPTSDVYFLDAMVLEPQAEGHLLVFDGAGCSLLPYAQSYASWLWRHSVSTGCVKPHWEEATYLARDPDR